MNASSTPAELPAVTRRKLSELFTREEITQLTRRSDVQGGLAVLGVWASIALCFAALAVFPNPFTFVLAVIVLGGRQLALAILSHEAAHRTLFRTPWLNDFVGDWLCARLIWNDVPRYRTHHLKHHTHTGTAADPDLSLTRNLPTTRRSLKKKFIRDLTGQTAVRRVGAQFLMDIGVLAIKSNMSDILTFLTNPKNTTTREYMLTCRLQADLLEAASNRNYHLQIYLPAVDRDGFDIIFSDAHQLSPVQVKSTATARSQWPIHRKFFRPQTFHFPSYKLYSSSHEGGMGGGVILIDVKNKGGAISLSYSYTDYLLVRLLSSGHFNFSMARSNAAKKAIEEMTNSIGGTFNLKRACFIHAPTTAHLLSLMGLHSTFNTRWRHEWLEYLNAINDKDSWSSFKEKPQELLTLIIESVKNMGLK